MSIDEVTTQRIAQMCTRLSSPSGPLAGAGPMRDLALRIAGALRDGRHPELDADLDELDDLLLRKGFTAGLSTCRSASGVAGIGDGHPHLDVLTCPAELCARVEPAEVERDCPVLGAPLRRTRLRP